ncbi:cytochrome P450 [Lentinula aciculospora]|uniref:Cytochrome P450 n=1 Tax=Lentinula aciculospora TaxID=153920 RepID=A0A9W9DHC0_9AGAR|nr:cytochrome P450 [Lentinula aciculospora]
MIMISYSNLSQGGTIICALVVHVIFNRTEPRNKTAWFFLLVCLPFFLTFGFQSFHGSLFTNMLRIPLIFLGTLLSSVVIYRLSPLHPLYGYPGPVLLKISRFASFSILFTGKQHERYQQLHEKYGLYVRTGPNHLHIADAKVISNIMNSPRFLKSERYNAVKREANARGLLGIVDPKEHSRRRRLWDRGLNTSALKGYQPLLENRINQFIETLRRESATHDYIDLAKWITFFSLDFMGDLAWGGVFNSMEAGKDVNGLLYLSQMVTEIHETAGTVPWTRLFYEHLPVSEKTVQQLSFAKRTVLDRIKRGCGETPDLFMYLLGEHDTTDEPLSLPTLVLETSFALIAGTDTSAMTLANACFYLLSYPDTLSRLKAEIDAACTTTDFNPNVLAGLPYLNAVLNETLRLQPVVPNGVQRVLLPGPVGQGEVVNNRYIPPQTNLQISTYCVQRDPANFSPCPDRFWPDRWLLNIRDSLNGQDRVEFRLNEEAFIPFSYGPTACAGKSLALMEMRVVLAAILYEFDLAFADKWNPAEWELNLEDFYTLRGGSLPVVLRPRKG